PDPWRQRPLSDVLAVQLIARRYPYRAGRNSRKIGIAFELILVLDDADQPRVSLATYPDREEPARADAAELADFLGVALLDEVSGKKAEAVVGDAGARRPGTSSGGDAAVR